MSIWKRKPLAQLLVEAAESEKGLKRTLTAWSLIALGIGAIIGAGLFVRTAMAASQNAGPSVTIAFIVAAIGCALAGLCYAELSSSIPISGSAYTYTYATMGEFMAWIIGWDLILEYFKKTLDPDIYANIYKAYRYEYTRKNSDIKHPINRLRFLLKGVKTLLKIENITAYKTKMYREVFGVDMFTDFNDHLDYNMGGAEVIFTTPGSFKIVDVAVPKGLDNLGIDYVKDSNHGEPRKTVINIAKVAKTLNRNPDKTRNLYWYWSKLSGFNLSSFGKRLDPDEASKALDIILQYGGFKEGNLYDLVHKQATFLGIKNMPYLISSSNKGE